AFDHLHGVAVKIPDDVEPRLVVVIGHIDDQRIPLPVATRISLPELNVVADMWTAVERDDSIRVSELDHHDHIPRRLEDLISTGGRPELSWHAGQVATRSAIDVFRFR